MGTSTSSYNVIVTVRSNDTTPLIYSTPVRESLCPRNIKVLTVVSVVLAGVGGILVSQKIGFGWGLTAVGVGFGLFTVAVFIKHLERSRGIKCCFG